MIRKVFIDTEYITLGQLLKMENIVESGGQVKYFLSEVRVTVNGDSENRRGRKLYNDDIVKIDNVGSFSIVSNGN